MQEGMIGLFKAFRDFRPDKLASFHAFAEICVTRQIITAIKTATRQKHIRSIPMCRSTSRFTGGERPNADGRHHRRAQRRPGELLIGRESYVSIESRIDEALCPWSAGFWRRIWTERAIRRLRRCSTATSRASTTRAPAGQAQARKLMAERGNDAYGLKTGTFLLSNREKRLTLQNSRGFCREKCAEILTFSPDLDRIWMSKPVDSHFAGCSLMAELQLPKLTAWFDSHHLLQRDHRQFGGPH